MYIDPTHKLPHNSKKFHNRGGRKRGEKKVKKDFENTEMPPNNILVYIIKTEVN